MMKKMMNNLKIQLQIYKQTDTNLKIYLKKVKI